MATTYDINDVVRMTGTFTDSGAALLDPTKVTVVYETPDGTATALVYGVDASVKKASSGVFYLDHLTTALGQYEYRFTSTGTGAASGETYFSVRGRRVST